MTFLARRFGCFLLMAALGSFLATAGTALAQSRRVPIDQDIRQYERLNREIDRETGIRGFQGMDLDDDEPDEGVQGFSSPGFLDNDSMDNGPMPPGAMVDEDID